MNRIISAFILTILFCPKIFSQNLNIQFRSKITYPNETLANVWGYVEKGREYALVGGAKGMVIVDITNPDAPQHIVQIPGPNNLWKEIKTYGHYAYVVSEGGQGLQIVDLSGLPSANLNSKFYTGDGAINGQLGRVHALHVDETKGFLYLYGASIMSGAPIVLDLKPDPWNPKYAGAFTQLGYVHDGYADNDTMYSGHIYAGQFAIVNMANKTAPQLVNTQTTPDAFTHNTWISDDRKTIFTTDERANAFLAAYDISNPVEIKFLDKIQSNPGSGSAVHNTYIYKGFAVTSWYKDGMTIVDASRPDNLVQTGNYDTYTGSGSGFDGCWGVYPYFPSGTIIASNIKGAGINHGELFILTPTYVRACHLEGKITDGRTGQPLNGAKIEVLGANPLPSETSNVSGIYKMGTVNGGLYTVKISKSGFQDFTAEVRLENGQLTIVDAALFPVGSLTIIAFVERALTQTLVPNATVSLVGKTLSYESKTDVNGFISFPFVKPGIYDVFASHNKLGHCVLYQQYLSTDSALTLRLHPDIRRNNDLKINFLENENKDKSAVARVLPNPFSGETTLFFEPTELPAAMSIFDARGTLISTAKLPADGGALPFGADFPAGIYFIRVENQGVVETIRVVKE